MSKKSSDPLTRGREKRLEGRTVTKTTLRVAVSAETRRAAAQIARDYSRRKLETVVAAFVADLAVAAERPGSWEHERVAGWLGSHVWECEPHD